MKHFMGRACVQEHGTGDVKPKNTKKWSVVRPIAEQLRDICLSAWSTHTDVMSQPDRWVCKDVVKEKFPSPYKLEQAMLRLHPQLRRTAKYTWAACYNMLHTKHLESQGVSNASLHLHAILFGARPTSRSERTTFTAYVPAEILECVWKFPVVMSGPLSGTVADC